MFQGRYLPVLLRRWWCQRLLQGASIKLLSQFPFWSSFFPSLGFWKRWADRMRCLALDSVNILLDTGTAFLRSHLGALVPRWTWYEAFDLVKHKWGCVGLRAKLFWHTLWQISRSHCQHSGHLLLLALRTSGLYLQALAIQRVLVTGLPSRGRWCLWSSSFRSTENIKNSQSHTLSVPVSTNAFAVLT